VVDLEAIREISHSSSALVCMRDNDDLVASVDELRGELVDVTFDSPWLGEEEVADHSDIVRHGEVALLFCEPASVVVDRKSMGRRHWFVVAELGSRLVFDIEVRGVWATRWRSREAELLGHRKFLDCKPSDFPHLQHCHQTHVNGFTNIHPIHSSTEEDI